jgi:hypothetical protein
LPTELKTSKVPGLELPVDCSQTDPKDLGRLLGRQIVGILLE